MSDAAGRPLPPPDPRQLRAPAGPGPGSYPHHPPAWHSQAAYPYVPPAAHLDGRRRVPQRPALLTAAAVATMVGSLVWLCGFSMFWLLVYTGMEAIADTDGFTGAYHLLYSVHLNLISGGAAPAYLLPSVALILGGMLLARRNWIRLALTGWGVLAVIWSAAWQWGQPALWAPAAAYIAVVVLVSWTPDVGRWYAWEEESEGPGLAQTPRQARMGA